MVFEEQIQFVMDDVLAGVSGPRRAPACQALCYALVGSAPASVHWWCVAAVMSL